MAKKMLGKVVAGAALGSASLLVFAPGAAYADGQPQTDEGKVFAKPHAVKAGEEVKLVQICPEEQEHPFVWSKVTGKVKLEPARDGGSRGDHKDWREENGAAEGADREGWSGHERSQPAEAESGSGWGGGAADARDDWKGEEHAQDAEGGDSKDHDKKDKKDWKDQAEESDSADEKSTGGWSGHENGSDSAEHDWSGKDDSGESDEREWSGKDDWSGESGESEWSGKSEWSGESGEREEWSGESGEREEWSGESGESEEWSGKRDWAADERGKGDSWEHKKDFVYYGEAQVAEDAKPGTYKLEGSCGTGELVVLPNGGVDGGDGGIATGADRGLAAAGASLVGAAALGGLVLMRRRRVDEFAA
ncbi:hypothetical protein [Micromonospora sp. C95]|uniref:hypothetical protein n=1 Tax=Micromonospora sp. C95 TaxID=2824882 RepID=UPI001B3795A9|nr:hypothetical protein [Micromonospora sp. C95]MBQ1027205.1 hypothetical protein [Micromonospora sp. C95]